MELIGRRYSIGIQNFEELRNRNCVYVDKTELVYELVNTDKVYFFSRPPPVWQESARVYAGGLFPGEKGTFRGTGHGTSGAGMGGLPGAARRLQSD